MCTSVQQCEGLIYLHTVMQELLVCDQCQAKTNKREMVICMKNAHWLVTDADEWTLLFGVCFSCGHDEGQTSVLFAQLPVGFSLSVGMLNSGEPQNRSVVVSHLDSTSPGNGCYYSSSMLQILADLHTHPPTTTHTYRQKCFSSLCFSVVTDQTAFKNLLFVVVCWVYSRDSGNESLWWCILAQFPDNNQS